MHYQTNRHQEPEYFACNSVKDKSLVLEELEQLRTVQTELTQQVADLTTELEKERSKVHSLQSELEKQQKSKVRFNIFAYFKCLI